MLRNLLAIITYHLASPRDRLHRESRERLHREAAELKTSLSSHDIAREDSGRTTPPSAGGAAEVVAPPVRLVLANERRPEAGWRWAA